MIIPNKIALVPNCLLKYLPILNPNKVKIKLVIANIIDDINIFELVIPRAIPTDKLSILTVKENKIIDNRFVIITSFSSFSEKNISMASTKNIIPTTIFEWIINF